MTIEWLEDTIRRAEKNVLSTLAGVQRKASGGFFCRGALVVINESNQPAMAEQVGIGWRWREIHANPVIAELGISSVVKTSSLLKSHLQFFGFLPAEFGKADG